MASPLEAWLLDHPEGVTADRVAREFLRLSGPPATLERIGHRTLDGTPGAVLGADGRWRSVRPAAVPPRAVALVALTSGPVAGADDLLALAACPVVGDRIEGGIFAVLEPARPVPDEALRPAGRSLADARPRAEIARLLAPAAAGAVLVAFESRRPPRFFRRLLRDAGRPEEPAGEVLLRPALRRAGRTPPRAGLAEACSALSVTSPAGNDPEARARAIAEIYLRALEEGIDLADPAPGPSFDFGSVGFGPDLLDRLPQAPGIYRFFDREGRLLYVGKARDLRSRVRSYFRPRSDRRRLYRELVERMWEVAWEETGSELGALLAEVSAIREEAPPLNVQTGVHRRRPASGDLVLFLPGGSDARAELLVLRDGRPAGRIEVSRRRPPLRRIRDLLADALGRPDAPPEEPADARIVTSWLHARSDEQNLLDLSETGGIEEALVKIRECLADPELFCGKFYRR